MSDILESALHLASLGYSVFPSSNGLPAIKEWPDKATTDEEQIRKWWKADVPIDQQQFNQVSICPKNSCVIIDVDVKDGKQGSASLQYLIDAYGLSKQTMIVKTKSGGLHLYYAYPPGINYIKSIAGWSVGGEELDGIDIRANRGQVRAPAGDGDYIIVNEVASWDLAQLPDDLIAQLPIDTPGGLRADGQDGKNLMSEKSPLRGELPDRIKVGERHETLLSLTASWARTTSYSNAVVLLKEAIARCDGDDITVEDYMERLNDAFSKFKPATDDKLNEMLGELVYVEATGGVYNIKTRRHSLMAKASNQYANRTTFLETTDSKGETKGKVVGIFSQWIKHPNRAEVIALGYKPTGTEIYESQSLGGRVANTYRKPISVPNNHDCSWFEDLVTFLWEDQVDAILDWIAHIVQKPTIKISWAPVLISTNEGIGKNLFFTIMSHVLGYTNTTDVRATSFSKQFNSFLLGAQLILINELQSVSKRDASNLVETLKSYITEDVQSVESKGQDAYKIEVYCNFIIFSNKIDCIDLNDGSRRFHVHINYEKPRSPGYYMQLCDQFMDKQHTVNHEAIGAVMGWLMRRDISRFNHGEAAINTEDKQTVINENKNWQEELIESDIYLHKSIFVSDVLSKSAYMYYIKHVLPNGFRMSPAQQRFLFKKYFIPIRLVNDGTRKTAASREFSGCFEVSVLSDETSVIKGEKGKMNLYTVRNHTEYGSSDNLKDVEIIKEEYHKIFEHQFGAISLVK